MIQPIEHDDLAILKLADQAVKDLEREINQLPKPFVWSCTTIEQVRRLKKHYEKGIEEWRKRLPGSHGIARQSFLEFIQEAERQLKDIYMVLETLEG